MLTGENAWTVMSLGLPLVVLTELRNGVQDSTQDRKQMCIEA